MQGSLRSIKGVVKNTGKNIDIFLDGRNVIFTGRNGVGKTSLLLSVYEKIILLLQGQEFSKIEKYKNYISGWQSQILSKQEGTYDYVQLENNIKSYQEKLKNIEEGINVEFYDANLLSKGFEEKSSVVLFYKAARLGEITPAENAGAIDIAKENARNKSFNDDYGVGLEQHLLNLKNRRSLAITENNDLKLAENIKNWFDNFESNLKRLMEDDSTFLRFDASRMKFYIKQKDKPEYTFQNLSSGYSAIFKVYSDLLMRSEYFDLLPSELKGLVFIDEVDAHLHVSLQKLILPFFIESFPKIQFLVSTHSPFVITSVKDFCIYDITNNSLIEKDLSKYSYSSVMQGLLGVDISSNELNDSIKRVADLTNRLNIGDKSVYSELKNLLKYLESNFDFMDVRSKAFFNNGLNAVLDKDAESV